MNVMRESMRRESKATLEAIPARHDAVPPSSKGLSSTARTLANPDATLGEYGQAKIRCWMNLVLISLALIAYQFQSSISLLTIWYTFIFTSVSAFALLVWAKALSLRSASTTERIIQRACSIVLDNISISWILYFGGESLAGVFSIYLWITIGYGMRFGLHYLYANLAASLFGFALVATESPFWSAYPSLSFGLGIGLLIVPLYAAYLITRLHEAVHRAESASRAKGDFLAKMSHELRTPLHGIIALADLLSGADSANQKQEMVRQITVSSNTLLDLINRILDISKYESGTFALQCEPMDLHVVIEETLSILSPQSNSKGIRLSVFVDSHVDNLLIGSPRQLQEVLINLAGNALKFTTEGEVRIYVVDAGSTAENAKLRISIADTGSGIPKAYLDRIFDPFSQADDSVTRLHGGTGLGTTIARDLVTLMNGKITIDSTVGVGTTVHVNLEFRRQLLESQQVPHYSLGVVVVGDPGRRQALVDTLRTLGVSQLNCISPENFQLAELDSYLVDCVFIDLDAMPEVLRLGGSILSPAGTGKMPFIGYGSPISREAAIWNGLLSFVPVEPTPRLVDRALKFVEMILSKAEISDDSAASHNGFSILIAEDNSTNQMIARIALERAGYRCTIVGDGEKALEELNSSHYDLALIDMHMPVMDGLEVARLYNFTSFDESRKIPLIMLTADSRPDVVADADLAGIARFVVKPIKPSALLRIVQDLLEHSRVQPERITDELSVAVRPTKDDGLAELDPAILNELLSFMVGDEAREFFEEFKHDALTYINSVKTLSDLDTKFSIVRDEMHALCGAARTVGAVRLAHLARLLEYSAEAEVRRNHDALAAELYSSLANVFDLIEARLSAAA